MSISIIIPFYKSFKYMDQIISHSKQLIKITDLEIIFVSDHNKGRDINYLKKKLLEIRSKKIYFYSNKKNFGPGIARNLGIKKSKKKWILFLDIDDKLNLCNFNKFQIFLKKNSTENVISFKHKLFKNNKEIRNLNYRPNLLKQDNYKLIKSFLRLEMDGSCIFHIYKRSFLLKNKNFFNRGFYEDIFFIYKVYYNNKRKIKNFNRTIYLKNNEKKSIINTFSLSHILGYYNSWSNIYLHFRKNKFENKEYLYNDLQYGLRGALSFLILKILNLRIPKSKKKYYINYTIKRFGIIIDNQFEIKTKYDKIAYYCLYDKKKLY